MRRLARHTLKDLEGPNLRWATRQKSIDRKIWIVKCLVDAFGDLPLGKITPVMSEGYVSSMLTAGRRPATCNRHVACPKHMFSKAADWEMVDAGNSLRIHRIKMLNEDNQRLRFLSVEEARRLVETCTDHLRPVVVCAPAIGMRRGEILDLLWVQNIELEHGLILLEKTKGGRPRQIPISDPLRAELERLPRLGKYVFCDADGQPYKDVKTSFNTACRKAGIKDFRFHDLRHTFASHLVMAGVPLATVAELLGHASITMMMRYAHLAPGHRRESIEVSSRLLPPPTAISTAQFTAHSLPKLKREIADAGKFNDFRNFKGSCRVKTGQTGPANAPRTRRERLVYGWIDHGGLIRETA